MLNLMHGYQVNLIHKSAKLKREVKFSLPFDGIAKPNVKIGQRFVSGEKLFTIENRKITESHFMPKELGVQINEIIDYVCRINGEFVSPGEIIAERIMSGGLSAKRILTASEGIVDFSRMKLGYLDILSEVHEGDYTSNFAGQIFDIDLNRGLKILTDIWEIPLLSVNSYDHISYHNCFNQVFGSFDVLGDGNGVYTSRDLKEDYSGKIVFAGRFLYPDLAHALYDKGCKYIVTGSMNYDDFSDLNLPVAILNGFGNIHMDKFLLFMLKEMSSNSVFIDSGRLSMNIISASEISKNIISSNSYYNSAIKVNDVVKSFDSDSYGLIGRVVSLEENGMYALVSMQNEATYLIYPRNLRLYSEEYSNVRVG